MNPVSKVLSIDLARAVIIGSLATEVPESVADFADSPEILNSLVIIERIIASLKGQMNQTKWPLFTLHTAGL